MTQQHRPQTTVILAMSADGKIADVNRSPARFGSINDKAHLEKEIATKDGVLVGAGTLRAYGTTLTVSHPDLLKNRQCNGKSPQPVHGPHHKAQCSCTIDPCHSHTDSITAIII